MSLLFGMFSSEKAWCQLCDYLSMKCQKEGVTFHAETKAWLQNYLEKQEALFFEIFFRPISSSLTGYQSLISCVTTYKLGTLSVNIAWGTQVLTLKRRFLRALPNTTAYWWVTDNTQAEMALSVFFMPYRHNSRLKTLLAMYRSFCTTIHC